MNKMTSTIPSEGSFRISTRVPFKLKRRAGHKTVVMAPETEQGHLSGCGLETNSQIALFQGLARAYYWLRLLEDGEVSSGSEIAQLEELDPSTVNELLRLTLLDPAFVIDILGGNSPKQASMVWFTRIALPDLWHEQFAIS